jgi:hypothetical protein
VVSGDQRSGIEVKRAESVHATSHTLARSSPGAESSAVGPVGNDLAVENGGGAASINE